MIKGQIKLIVNGTTIFEGKGSVEDHYEDDEIVGLTVRAADGNIPSAYDFSEEGGEETNEQ